MMRVPYCSLRMRQLILHGSSWVGVFLCGSEQKAGACHAMCVGSVPVWGSRHPPCVGAADSGLSVCFVLLAGAACCSRARPVAAAMLL
jgi:hypothetical protein